MYSQRLFASWGDMDFNAHMRNTAYLDKAADVRMRFFAEHDFPMSEFVRQGLGPVVMKDEIEYMREFHLLEEVEVSLCLAGMSDDGSRMFIRNEFFREGKLAARVTSTVGWLDRKQRRLICPPGPLLAALQALDKSDDFAVLPSSANSQ
ncbi:thioesterase family protein [Burkholderia sp. FERM BP-3421]|jgi:acyl-CoA thioester hydrolase|uniref:acyl-CoA thioesterase n=1 Tax=Burkholderia sp. FERM BP-3421 TaxID=1494466 RepID=UPI00235EFBB7|nr:thioesterase family protein [Burkholderia sp. FERM BP-3421]WDD94309.1 thioesterase family protein [Burkholderia sp. FERM BP-3421]